MFLLNYTIYQQKERKKETSSLGDEWPDSTLTRIEKHTPKTSGNRE